MPVIQELHGDLFDRSLTGPVDCYVNPVNCVGVMGKGIAAEFKNRWPEMFATYRLAFDAGELQLGKLHVWNGMHVMIVNLPTKRHWRHNSELIDVERGVIALAELLALQPSWFRVAVPALGCGEGKLSWEQVRPMLHEHLERLACDVMLLAPR